MSLCFNTLSSFVITFLPRSKRLLISWWTDEKLISSLSVESKNSCVQSREKSNYVTTFV